MAPPIGLIGSEQALLQGQAGALGALNAGNQGIERQAALAGLRGNQAQGQAFQNFQASPGQAFLQEQGRIGLERGASATGGLGGGNIQRELQAQRIGLASQDFNNQFQRGQQVLGSQQALAPTAAGIFSGTGQNIAQGRTQAGSALSSLLNQQGSGASNIIGQSSSNIANLLSGFGGAQGASQEQLAGLLANLALQQGSSAAGAPSAAQFVNTGGIIGDIGTLAGGAGGLLTGAAALSDVRLKENIKKVGELDNGLGVYTWTWNKLADTVSGIKMNIGVLAQEVQKVMPKAVILDESGYLKVNYEAVLNG